MNYIENLKDLIIYQSKNNDNIENLKKDEVIYHNYIKSYQENEKLN